MFGLTISYLPEINMPALDAGEELVDSDFVLHRLAKSRTKAARRRPREMIKSRKGKKPTNLDISSRSRTDTISKEAEADLRTKNSADEQ